MHDIQACLDQLVLDTLSFLGEHSTEIWIVIKCREPLDMDSFKEKALTRFCDQEGAVQFHLDPAVEIRIEVMYWITGCVHIERCQLKLHQNRPCKLEVGIIKPLEVNQQRLCIILKNCW